MATDLVAAERLGAAFRSHAYKNFEMTLSQARTDNAETTRVGFILIALLVGLVGLGAWVIILGIMGNVHGEIGEMMGC